MSSEAFQDHLLSDSSDHIHEFGGLKDRESSLTDYPQIEIIEPPTCRSKYCKDFNVRFFIIFCVFSLLMTFEYVIRTANSTYYMINYRVFLNFVLLTFCTLAFFAIIIFKRYYDHTLTTLLNKEHIHWFLLVSIFDTIGVYMIILSAAFVSATLTALLAQGVVPISMLLSKIFLYRKYDPVHYLGSAVIVAAIGVQLFAIAYEPSDNFSSFGWGLAFLLSNIPIAVGGIMKEMLLSPGERMKMPRCLKRCVRRRPNNAFLLSADHPYETSSQHNGVSNSMAEMGGDSPAEMHSLNAWVAGFQVLMSIILSPVAYAAQGSETDPTGIFENLEDGFNCWLFGENTLPTDTCEDAFWMVLFHVAVLVLLNITALMVIMQGSTVIFFLASAVSIPLTILATTPEFIQHEFNLPYVTFSPVDIVSVTGVLIGIVIYRSKPERSTPQASP